MPSFSLSGVLTSSTSKPREGPEGLKVIRKELDAKPEKKVPLVPFKMNNSTDLKFLQGALPQLIKASGIPLNEIQEDSNRVEGGSFVDIQGNTRYCLYVLLVGDVIRALDEGRKGTFEAIVFENKPLVILPIQEKDENYERFDCRGSGSSIRIHDVMFNFKKDDTSIAYISRK